MALEINILSWDRSKHAIRLDLLIELPVEGRVMAMVFNATFNNISVISWRSVILVEEIRISGENYRLGVSH
jgi:hypothetical protein